MTIWFFASRSIAFAYSVALRKTLDMVSSIGPQAQPGGAYLNWPPLHAASTDAKSSESAPVLLEPEFPRGVLGGGGACGALGGLPCEDFAASNFASWRPRNLAWSTGESLATRAASSGSLASS